MIEDTNFYQLLRAYYTFIHNRTQTLFLLVQNDCLWDADIILRPIAECTVKFAFISSFDNPERNEKVREFWEDLAEINRLKQSKQAKQIIELTNIDSKFLSDIILEENEHRILSEKWTKSNRQRTEQLWSYNEMIKTISTNYDFKEILGLARNFTQSSHLIHADETALGVINDREQRTEEQREALMNFHEIRLLSDCVQLYLWLVKVCSKLSDKELDSELIKKVEEFENGKEIFKPLNKIIE
ncbi:hypothetical protein KIM67_01200 [Flagellimonas sp. 389]|uniref:DUF5677 domain-containing protein n=1 Tax=Flagellimonas sp. 389 TaxID=2835862 RepID=UPI001BD50F25|nr:DUF5677 domain-containing protein [Flagellimonas sp. 389]MBS9461007.1 hypothetical protein [Flagellimonas sp. 389]